MAAAVAAAQQPVSAQVVGNAFVQQYYHILHHSPGLVFRFYQDTSKLGRPEDDGSMSITTTMQVMHLKESAATFSPPLAPAPRKIVPKSVEQVRQPPAAAPADSPALSSDFIDNVNNQEGEADGHSIYIKGLPMSATAALLEDEFKKFGSIKNGGIQVRSNRQQGFCFGFVEFEVATAVQQAIEASPMLIGGRQAAVEEKKSTNSRGNTRGRYPSGRGSGFRNDGVRGRGNYGGSGRGYNRGDFNGRSEFNNRGGNRGGSSNRGGDGYQRTDNMGGNSGRMNRGGWMPNGTAKNMTPRISATA